MDNPTLQKFDPDLCRAKKSDSLIVCLSPSQAHLCQSSLPFGATFYCLNRKASQIVTSTIWISNQDPPKENK